MSSTMSRLFLVGALAVAGSALAYVAFSDLGENLVYYWEPTQLREAGKDAMGSDIRLAGVVKEGSLHHDVPSQTVHLVVSDGTYDVPVVATGAPPPMMREGIGVIVEGQLQPDGTFRGDRLLVKHSNEYQAPTEDMTPEERQALYKSIYDEFGEE